MWKPNRHTHTTHVATYNYIWQIVYKIYKQKLSKNKINESPYLFRTIESSLWLFNEIVWSLVWESGYLANEFHGIKHWHNTH